MTLGLSPQYNVRQVLSLNWRILRCWVRNARLKPPSDDSRFHVIVSWLYVKLIKLLVCDWFLWWWVLLSGQTSSKSMARSSNQSHLISSSDVCAIAFDLVSNHDSIITVSGIQNSLRYWSNNHLQRLANLAQRRFVQLKQFNEYRFCHCAISSFLHKA